MDGHLQFFFVMSIWNPRWLSWQDKFNIGPYGINISKLFQSEPMNHLKANLTGMFLGWSYTKCVFCVNQNFKMVTTAGHYFNIGPYGKSQNHLTANIAGVCLRWSFTIYVFLCRSEILRWLPQHGSFSIGPYEKWFFFIKLQKVHVSVIVVCFVKQPQLSAV